MGLIGTVRGYLGGILTSRRAEEDGEDFSTDFETSVLDLSLRTLQVATDSFSQSNKIGGGGFGSVYKGVMPDGQEIAVKKHTLNSTQGAREFTNEVKLMSELRHLNVVTLLGCCAEGPEKMLVYEYLPNKSLDRFIFDKKQSSCLDWETRFRIATGVARGLLYLHEEAPMRILHRDIKASNILLDEKLTSKISDFGLAWLFPEEDAPVNTSRICGTYGYMAPEYAIHGELSSKTDVFSYGILLLEIVSGRRNHGSELGKDRTDLVHSAWELYQAGKTLELVDPSLNNYYTYYDADEARMCIQIALLCCQESADDRPDMNSIHVMLSRDSFILPAPGQPAFLQMAPRAGQDNAVVEDYSRNTISVSSIDDGR